MVAFNMKLGIDIEAYHIKSCLKHTHVLLFHQAKSLWPSHHYHRFIKSGVNACKTAKTLTMALSVYGFLLHHYNAYESRFIAGLNDKKMGKLSIKTKLKVDT